MGDESIFSSGMRSAKRALGLGTSGKDVNLPVEDDEAEKQRKNIAAGASKLRSLIGGSSDAETNEQIRSNKQNGMSEYDAVHSALRSMRERNEKRRKK